LKRPTKERGHTPRGAYHRSPWIEPAVWDADFGSSAPFFASVFALSGEASWLVTRENCTKSNEYGQYRVDTVTSGKEKAREHREPELGATGGSIGGRAQWVKRAQRVERASERIDIAVWWRSTVAGAVRVETSRISGDRR